MSQRFLAGLNNYASNVQTEHYPPSSGDTVPLEGMMEGVDETNVDEGDEGYQTNFENRKGNRDKVGPNEAETQSQSTDGGLELLGRGVKELMQGIQRLRHLGVEDLVLPLPKIVVVGDQSTGKSSLIEGMRISVSKVVKCPMEINLSESLEYGSEWQCKVSLVMRYIYDGNEGSSKYPGATRARPLGPWIHQSPPENYAFATVKSKAEVKDFIYWAQLAVLNPQEDYRIYIPGGNQNTRRAMKVRFSPNVVKLDDEEKYLVKLVSNLVKEYIKSENSLNLLALPMTHDAANSSAARIVSDVKAQNRTVGVLTKPDRVPPSESLDQWVSILSGKSFQLGFGYHVIKNNPDPQVDNSTARIEEEEFFRTIEPYATKLAQYRDRFGTFRLQEMLSRKLTAQILWSIPLIFEQVQKKVISIEDELKDLPEPPAGNLPMIIHGKVNEFSRDLQRHIDGGSPDLPFQKVWHGRAMDFRKTLMESRPVLVFPKRTEGTPSRSVKQDPEDEEMESTEPITPVRQPSSAEVHVLSDDEDIKPEPGSSRARKRTYVRSAQSTPSKRPKTFELPAQNREKSDLNGNPRREAKMLTTEVGAGKRFTMEDIREFLKDGYLGLPDQIDPKSTERMIILSIDHWTQAASNFLEETEELCQKVILERVDIVFGQWRSTRLYKDVLRICKEFLSKEVSRQKRAVDRAFHLERHKPITLNAEGMGRSQESALTLLETRRRQFLASEFVKEQEERSGKMLTDQARLDRINKVTDSQLGKDPYKNELRAMVDVRAYYECAFSRFVDVIYQGIQAELFVACRDKLWIAIVKGLRVEENDADEHCQVLLAVDPKLEEKRLQLKKEHVNLLQAQDWLNSLRDRDRDPEHPE